MKPLSWRSLLLAAGFAFVLAGCESPTPRPMGSGASMDDTGDVIGNVPETTDSGGGIPEKDRLDLRGGVEYGAWRAIHFDFDSAVVREEDRGLLEEIAQWCKENPDQKLMVAGHCDERGTIEYNRALGQRRAAAARDYLIRLGASSKQVGTVSYGEDQPVDPGHNEEAWTKNRRGEFGKVP
ncbi:MAG: OmpA family protein [Verrucomicrobiae bacterium]|nr:OmpA family protein [Verrucomicrobiae bacterium]